MSGILRANPLRSCPYNSIWLSSKPPGVISNIRRFASTPLFKTIRLSPPNLVAEERQQTTASKWGNIIYRTTYKDDQAWDRFKQKLQAETEEEISFYKGTSDARKENHEWRFVEDPALLDGASKTQLRARFKQWRTQVAPKDTPRDQHGRFWYDAQFRYFIQVDSQSLQDLQDWGWDGGSVNLIDADWQSITERWPDEDFSDDGELSYEPVEGCTEEHVGWMMIAGPAISAKLWGDEMYDTLWYVYYRRPGDILYHC
jgi:hypothetical protein